MSAVLVVPLVLAVFAAVEGLTRWTALPPTTHDTGDYVSVIDDPAPRIDDPGPRVITDTLVGDSPRGVAITGDGRRVFVCNFFSDDVSVIDAVGNTVVTTLPVGDYLWDKNRPWDKAMPLGISVVPAGKKFAPDGYKAYVANHGSDTVSVIKIGEG